MNRARALLSLLSIARCLGGCASDWDSLRGRAFRDVSVDFEDASDDLVDALDARADVAVDAIADAALDAASDARLDAAVDARSDASLDVATDVSTDARGDVSTDVRSDGGVDVASDVVTPPRCHPTIDGAIGADWTASAALSSNTVATAWGAGVNELRSMRVCVDDTALYLGIEGVVESTNAIVAFIDRDDGATTGITSGRLFADRTGALDVAISPSFTAFPAGVGVDMVWGTRGMSTHRGAVIDSVGLRDVRSNPMDYGWIAGDETACSGAAGGACEVAIPWAALYGAAGRPAGARLAIFLRLGNGDGTMASNQTLPQDAPATPFAVTRVMRIETGP